MIVRVFPPIARTEEFVDLYVMPPWPEHPKTDDRTVRVWFVRNRQDFPSPKVHPETTVTFPAHVTAQLPSGVAEGIYEPFVEWGGGRFQTGPMYIVSPVPATPAPLPSNSKRGDS